MKRKLIKILFIILFFNLSFLIFSNSALAVTCEGLHVNFTGKCVPTGDNCPSDKQGIDTSRPDLCLTGEKCCYKTVTDSGTDLKNIQLQIPLFDFSAADNIAQYIAKIYEYILIIFVPLTIIMIILGGIQWVIAAGDAGKITAAKKQIIQAFVGLFIGLTSYLILSVVGITSLNLPEIQTIQRIEGEALILTEGGGAGGGGGADGTSPETTIDPNSCTGTWRGMPVKCLDPNLGGAKWDGSAKDQLVAQGPVLISKTVGAPPYFVQYVESSKTAGKKIIAITFDLCTPSVSYKKSIGTYLVSNNIKATFFLGSDYAAAHADVFNFIKSHSNLFEIGNHSKSHPVGESTSPFWDGAGSQSELDTQWKESQAWFTSKGVTPKVCRLPVAAPTRMERSGSIKFLKAASPCTEFIQYSMWPGDTANNLNAIKPKLKVGRGEILLLHGGYQATADTLPSIIEFLEKQGYTFYTVSELLSQYGG